MKDEKRHAASWQDILSHPVFTQVGRSILRAVQRLTSRGKWRSSGGTIVWGTQQQAENFLRKLHLAHLNDTLEWPIAQDSVELLHAEHGYFLKWHRQKELPLLSPFLPREMPVPVAAAALEGQPRPLAGARQVAAVLVSARADPQEVEMRLLSFWKTMSGGRWHGLRRMVLIIDDALSCMPDLPPRYADMLELWDCLVEEGMMCRYALDAVAELLQDHQYWKEAILKLDEGWGHRLMRLGEEAAAAGLEAVGLPVCFSGILRKGGNVILLKEGHVPDSQPTAGLNLRAIRAALHPHVKLLHRGIFEFV